MTSVHPPLRSHILRLLMIHNFIVGIFFYMPWIRICVSYNDFDSGTAFSLASKTGLCLQMHLNRGEVGFKRGKGIYDGGLVICSSLERLE